MIKLIGLNLLPYREIARQKKKAEFNRMMIAAMILGFVLAGVVWFLLNSLINDQEGRNQTLRDGIGELNKKIEQVKELEERRDAFLARKNKIEELENERYKAAMIFNDLNRLMPDGTFLTHIQSKDGTQYSFTGVALSDSKVAAFMRSLPSTGLFEEAKLVEIKTEKGVQVFTVETKLTRKVDAVSKKQAK
ncbi:MAG: PilN domain-containing protein [Neisseriaceae bacterium]|nr:PilN domain-containing protein [Neisseriaceae bacterium]